MFARFVAWTWGRYALSSAKRKLKKIFSRSTLVLLTILLLFLVDVLLVYGVIIAVELALEHILPDAATVWIQIGVTVIVWFFVFTTVLNIVSRDMVPEAKITWLLCVVCLSLFGVMIYAIFSVNRPSKSDQKLYRAVEKELRRFHVRELRHAAVSSALGDWAQVSEALYHTDYTAVLHGGTKTEFCGSGEGFFLRLKEDLKRAEKYIFLEYFIFERGKMWDEILAILLQKVKEGVEVRVLYDDIGCMGKLRLGYAASLRKQGINCRVFNCFVPVVSNIHNNRDHRKIAVIDGKIGYTGGINIADEYINETHPFGHWKDSAVRLEGRGVKTLSLMFLQLFSIECKHAEDFSAYIPKEYEDFGDQGYVQAYGDGPRPMYKRDVGENVYLNIINGAKKYVWITTPYLIIDYRLREALIRAAERGVDVRLITPHIPDKKVVFALTRSNYLTLIRGGVKIYEYTPGFVHAKHFLADDEAGVVGTINLDYRSFLHHFECAVFMYGTQALAQMKQDFLETFAVSALQTEEDAKKSVISRLVCNIAKVFAPLF